jgi:hypothetical protein
MLSPYEMKLTMRHGEGPDAHSSPSAPISKLESALSEQILDTAIFCDGAARSID